MNSRKSKKITKKDITNISKEISRLEKERKELIEKFQNSCSHPISNILEAPYKENTYINSYPPFRVCKKCGYHEEGWYTSYHRLGKNFYKELPTLSRDEAGKLIIGRRHNNKEVAEDKAKWVKGVGWAQK